MATTHVKFNLASIKRKLDVIDDETRLFAQNMFYKAMDGYIPFETGMLQRSVDITPEGVRFFAPYAQYLYFGKLMVSPTTRSAWAKKDERKVLTNVNLKYSLTVKPLACADWGHAAMLAKRDEIVKSIRNYIRMRNL